MHLNSGTYMPITCIWNAWAKTKTPICIIPSVIIAWGFFTKTLADCNKEKTQIIPKLPVKEKYIFQERNIRLLHVSQWHYKIICKNAIFKIKKEISEMTNTNITYFLTTVQ